MSGRHRTRSSKSNLLIGSIAASVGVSSVLSAAIVELVSAEQSTAPPPALERSVTQEGRLIAVTAEVSIIATQRGDAVVATAVAEKAVTDGTGPPMDYGV